MMNNPRRLHPVAALLKFLRSLREMIIPVFIFLFVGGRATEKLFDTLYFSSLIVIISFMLIYGILTWLRFTYRVEAGELRIEHGVFFRKKRYIPIERIQTIDVTEGLIQRLFGLVKFQVETAGGGNEAEAVFSAITKAEAAELRRELTAEEVPQLEVEEDIGTKDVFTLSNKEFFIMASTSGGIGVIISALFAFLTQFDELLPLDNVYNAAQDVVQSGIALVSFLIFFVILVAWVISMVRTAIKFGNYKVTKKGDELVISRGLIEKREITIPTRRIQAVRIQENIIRQLLGYATVYMEVAGGGNDEKGEYSTILFPIVHLKKLKKNVSLFTPDFWIDEELVPLPNRAKKRYVLRLLVPTAIFVSAISYFLHPWGFLSLILIPISVLLGIAMHREAGWASSGNHLKLRYRFLSRQTVFARKNRIQALHLSSSYFQRAEDLASITVSTQSKMVGKHFKVLDVDGQHAFRLYEWYSYEGQQPF
jgi:putative membrane protein